MHLFQSPDAASRVFLVGSGGLVGSALHRQMERAGYTNLAYTFVTWASGPWDVVKRAVNNCPFDEDAVLLKAKDTVDLLSAAGLTSVKSRFILSIPAANKPLRSIDRLFSLIPFGAQYYVSARRS